MKQGTAIIVGAGPAGLTAAIELQRHSEIKPIVLEASQEIGGISRTVRYKGNRMDIGGHRFFSKSDRVMHWWLELMPVEAGADEGGQLHYQGQQRDVPAAAPAADPQTEDLVMLVRQPQEPHLFSAPLLRLSHQPDRCHLQEPGPRPHLTLRHQLHALGTASTTRGADARRFLINRFGKQLYLTFFKSYTEKVWGVPCHEISAEWGAQRIKGLSLKSVVAHFLKKAFGRKQAGDLAQKRTETSLIEKFLYPKFGPGQLWEHAADLVRKAGGEIHLGMEVDRIHVRRQQGGFDRGRQRRGRARDLRRRLFLLHHAGARSDPRHLHVRLPPR